MAQGHLISYLALAQFLEQKGFSVTIVNTPLNIKNLHKSIPPCSSIKLAEIPFNSSDHGLPPAVESTDSISYNFIPRFVQATASLELPFRRLLSELTQKPLCVVSDFVYGWAADATHEHGIFHAIFCPTGGFGMACYYSIWLNLPHKHSDGVEFSLPDFHEAGKIHVCQLNPAMAVAAEDESGTIFLKKHLSAWSSSDALLLNTVEELDRSGLAYFRRKLAIPVSAIGPLLLPKDLRATNTAGRESAIGPEQCIEWLDKKPPNSVIYISFGSQFTISASQMMNLAKALDASGTSFIWVVRPPLGFDINGEFLEEEWLPQGFHQQIRDEERGLIVRRWAPQMDILAHKSVAAFICHCGWNSVLESLKNGVPLLGWPIGAEQFYNATMLVEEAGVCVEVARGFNEVAEKDIRDKMELVRGKNEKGIEIRRRACEIKEIFRDATRDEGIYKGSSLKAMEDLFNATRLKCF